MDKKNDESLFRVIVISAVVAAIVTIIMRLLLGA